MARHVTGTSGFYLDADIGATIPFPVTIACRIKFDAAVPAGGAVSMIYGEWFPSPHADYLQVLPTGVTATTAKESNFFGASQSVTIVPGQWYLCVGVFDGSGPVETSQRVYVNNGSQTAVNFQAVAYTGAAHPTRHLTLGGLLLAVGSLYTAAGFDGDIADAAIWDTALTVADVDALAAGRPGTVKPANLKAWYKLGADGDLASSVGTYPAMTVYGTCPVTPDPMFPDEMFAAIVEASALDYLPGQRAVLDDPLSRSLTAWMPMTEAYTTVINDVITRKQIGVPWNGGASYLTWDPDGGINNVWSSFTMELEAPWSTPGIGYCLPAPFTVSIWGKSFYTAGIVWHMGIYGYHTGVKFYYGSVDGGVVAYRYDGANNLVSSVASSHFGWSSTRWTHGVITLSRDLTLSLYLNGYLEGRHQNPTPETPATRFRVARDNTDGGGNYGSQRDLRIYKTALSDREVLELYSRGYAKPGNEWSPRKQFPLLGEKPVNFITANAGAFTTTGYPATLRKTRYMQAEGGVFTETGYPADLRAQRRLTADKGTFNLSGQIANLRAARKMIGGPGVFALDGQPVSFQMARYLQAGGGEFLLTGQDAMLKVWIPMPGSGRIYYVAKQDRIVFIPSDPNIGE